MSYFKSYCQECIQEARIAGMKLNEEESLLQKFDKWVDENYPAADELTKELAENWIYSYTGTSKRMLNRRVTAIKYLSKYIRSLGLKAWVPDYFIKKDPPKPKTLMNDEDINILLDYIDHLPPHPRSPHREYLYPVIYRLALLTGMRVSEIIHLKKEDMDLTRGAIRIMKSKGWKDREIYVSPSLLELLKRFDAVYSEILPDREFFFQPSYEIPCLTNYQVGNSFIRFMKRCGLYDKYPIKPTFHGFRHLFTVKSMIKCQESGGNFDNQIKYLSLYLGHKNVQETRYYIHSLVQGIPALSKKMKSLTEGIEVVYEEY